MPKTSNRDRTTAGSKKMYVLCNAKRDTVFDERVQAYIIDGELRCSHCGTRNHERLYWRTDSGDKPIKI